MSSDPSDSSYGKEPGINSKLTVKRIMSSKLIDLIFGIFCLAMIAYYIIFILEIETPIWDGAVYLINAHEWLNNTTLSEIYVPPLFSWIIAAIWIFTGENWTTLKYVQLAFTIASIILLYIILRKRKGALFAFGVSALTLTNAQLFFYTSQIRSEGISLFLLILTLYFFEGTKKTHWLLSGIAIGLTFAARYPILLQALIIFVVESILKKDPKSTGKASIVIISVILLVVGIMYAKTGTFQMGLESDFGSSLTSFYIVNALPIWGPAIILLPIAFLFKSTYKDKFNYIFIAWFIVSLVSWSTNGTSQQYRFMIQLMPPAYFLVILAIENLIKLDRNNLIFLKSTHSGKARAD